MGAMKQRVWSLRLWLFCILLMGMVMTYSVAAEQDSGLPIQLPNLDDLQGSPLAPTKDWEDQISGIEQQYAHVQPSEETIVFIGSSSIRRWDTLEQDFPGYPVINAGFGGSHIIDSVYFADRIVIPFQPHTVVFFAGSNDINAGKSPLRVLADYVAFVNKVHETLPDTRIVFLSISTSPRRWEQRNEVIVANELIRLYTETDERLAYVNIYDPMLGEDGLPLRHLYVSDELHMTAAGYAIWVDALQPFFAHPFQDVWLTRDYEQDDTLALRVDVAPEIAAKSVELTVAERVLYQGTNGPEEVIVLKNVPDGRHRAQLTVETADGKAIRRSYTVTVQNVTIHEPDAGDVLRGVVDIQLSTRYDTDHIAYATVSLIPFVFGDRVEEGRILLYRDKKMPEQLSINAMALSDGAYDLVFSVTTQDGTESEVAQRVVVRNWTTLTDAFDPPQDLGWFGLSDRKQTIFESAGWDYAVNDPELFFNDDQRRVWLGEGEGQLIWKTPDVRRYELVVYTKVLNLVDMGIQVSSDEKQWDSLLARVERVDVNEKNEWHKIVLTGSVPSGMNANYVRVQLGESLHGGVFQLGQARFIMLDND